VINIVVESGTFIRDLLFYVKDTLTTGVTDPITATRSTQSRFVMTSYPSRFTQYPLITVKLSNYSGPSSGMQTNAMDITAIIEIRVWARNQKEKDELANDCFIVLRDAQHTASTGSIANYIYDFALLSAVEVDEDGENQPKSRILEVQYKYYNI